MSSLPSGTAAFLFTDIEGSTRLWEEHPDAMGEAVARHDEILREVVEEHGGHVFSTAGDAFSIALDRVEDAVEAAVAAQLALIDEDWGGVDLRVRMAIHTGEAEERDGDYFGSALNRAARVLAAGHGGQILVTLPAHELAADGAPSGVAFEDQGAHRLRDLSRPERIFQLRHPRLRVEFPPLASLDAHPNNLPVQLTSFVGRVGQVEKVGRLLSGVRMVTLTGVGGVGKTRLALQVAVELLEGFSDGVWLVELAPIADPKQVVAQTAGVFGVREMNTTSGRKLVDVLVDYLADKDMLVVFDNCEHVVESAAGLAELLMSRCPGVRILATSRELLGVSGEMVEPVPPLGLPDTVDGEGDALEESEAVRLFRERAAQVNPDFRLNTENLKAVQGITRRLDGLPLAIELAASRANLLTPGQILRHLGDQFRLLITGRREGRRHSTLDTALEWSYDLLSPHERTLFRRLAIFAGGWTLDAAGTVCDQPEGEVLDLLGRLVDQSLVEVTEVEGANRYRLLEPVRQYALAQLQETGEEDTVREAHSRYFLALAETSETELRGPRQDEWLRRMEREHSNLRSAAEWSLDTGRDESVLRLVGAMGWFWLFGGYFAVAREWFDRALRTTRDPDPVVRARAVYKLANPVILMSVGRGSEVRTLLEEAVSVLRERGTTQDIAWACLQLGLASFPGPAGDRALKLIRESLRLFAEGEDRWGEASARHILGAFVWDQDPARGEELQRKAIESFVRLGDRWTAGWFSFGLGDGLRNDGRYEEARRVYQKGMAMVEDTQDRWIGPHCRSRLGLIAMMTGDPEEAKHLLKEVLPVFHRIGDENCIASTNTYLGELFCDEADYTTGRSRLVEALSTYREELTEFGGRVVHVLRRMGWLAAAMGDHERAARLLGATEALRQTADLFVSSHDQTRMDQVIESLRARVDSELLERWWDNGAEMSLDEAVEYALDV